MDNKYNELGNAWKSFDAEKEGLNSQREQITEEWKLIDEKKSESVEIKEDLNKKYNEIGNEWKNIDAKNAEIAFEKQDLANSWQRLEDETLRQKQQNELELIKSENKLTNKYLEDVAD